MTDVATAFVQHYYSTLDTNAMGLATLYVSSYTPYELAKMLFYLSTHTLTTRAPRNSFLVGTYLHDDS